MFKDSNRMDFNTPQNISKNICRICLKEVSNPTNIFEINELGITIAQMIASCSSLSITEDDYFPKVICKDCIFQLQFSYNFKLKCEKAYITLRNQHKYFIDKKVLSYEEFFGKNDNTNGLLSYASGTKGIYLKYEKVGNSILEEIKEINHENYKFPKEKSTDLDEKTFNLIIKCQFCNQKLNLSLQEKSQILSCEKVIKENENWNRKIETDCESFMCKFCGEIFAELNLLKVHLKTHSREKTFTCKICSKSFTRQKGLNVHLLSHSSFRQFLCAKCGKLFLRYDDLKKHHRIHIQERPYVCSFCPKAFIQSFHLTEHLRTHSNLKKFKCNICEKSFSRSGSLRIHLRIHTKNLSEKRHSCITCGRSFSFNYSLKKHMMIHTGQKPFSCNVCSKSFTQIGHLKVHKKTHSGEKSFVCQVCGRGFAIKSRLTIHTRTHTGEKPYVCNICGKGCTTSTMLKIHNRIHTGEMPYRCLTCTKAFSRSDLLSKHKKIENH